MSLLGELLELIWSKITGPRPLTREELDTALDNLAVTNPERLDWRNSIVDLLKLVGKDSSLLARERLAVELGFEGAFPAHRPQNGSVEMNVWLHQKVMEGLLKR